MRHVIRVLFYILVAVVILIGPTIDLSSHAENAVIADKATRPSGSTYKEKWATNMVDNLYGNLNDDIKDVTEILSMNPDSNSAIWSMIKGVSNALVPVGFSVASAFILISFLNKAMMFQFRSYEDVAKVLLYMMLAKVVLESSFELLGFIYQASANLISTAAIAPGSVSSNIDKAALVEELSKMNVLEQMQFQISQMPIATLMGLIKIVIKVVAYGRLFEIYVYTAVAALPLATLASPDHHQVAKKFIQSYIGVCLQGLIMMLSCVIYSALAVEFIDPSMKGDLSGGGGGFLLGALVLLFVLVKSGSWGKQIAGLA